MGISSFHRGALVTIRGKSATLLRCIDPDLWQIEDNASKRITELTRAELDTLYVQSQLTFMPPAGRQSRGEAKSGIDVIGSGPEWDAPKIRRQYVNAVLDLPNTRSSFEPAIAAVWTALKEGIKHAADEKPKAPAPRPDWTTVYRWKARYLMGGKDIAALFSRAPKRGNHAHRYPEDVLNFVRDAIDAVYLNTDRGTIQDTLDSAEAKVNRENRQRPTSMQLKTPTRRLVTRMIRDMPAFDIYAARHGRQQAVRRFRSVLKHRTTEAPLERAEIDHTPLDLIVIDDESGLPLGRPYLTVCLDDYTRCVLGLFVSFEPPSYYTVSRALKHAFLPKTDLKTTYPGIVNTWDAHGVMRELVVDNGQEFHSASLENACYTLGIELHYSPRKTPWFKGKIERFLGTMNRECAHGVPGTTFSNIFDKGDYDPVKSAVVRFSVFKEVLHRWVVDVYHEREHRTTKTPPAALWKSSIAPDDILLPDDPAQFDLILGKSDVRSLTHRGIIWSGLVYNSPELKALHARIGDTKHIEIRVNSADIGSIFVIEPNRTTAIKVPALQRAYANGLSEWQHECCKRYAANKLGQYDPAGWLEAKEKIRELIINELQLRKARTNKRLARHRKIGVQEPLPTGQGAVPSNVAMATPVDQGTSTSASRVVVKKTIEMNPITDPPVSAIDAPPAAGPGGVPRTEPSTVELRAPRARKYAPVIRERSAAVDLEEREEEVTND